MNRHLILTNGRSGSNYLVTLLNSHPQITNYGEVLGDWTLPYKLNSRIKFGSSLFNNDQDYLDYIYNSKLFFYSSQIYSMYSRMKRKERINFKTYTQIKHIGIKDFSINFKRKNIADYLINQANLLVINLYRENSLKRLISLAAMQTTGVVALRKNYKSQKLYLPTKKILNQLDVFEREKDEQFEMIKSLPESRVMNISYESYFADSHQQDRINQQILDFLGVDALTINSKHQKILGSNLSNILENYDEVCQILLKTKYEKYLEN